MRALQALEGAPVEHPRAWLLAIIRNTAFTWLAKNRPHVLVLAGGEEEARSRQGALEDPSSADAGGGADRQRRPGDRRPAAIDALPLVFKETLVMREINGLSYREIAQATGAPIGTVMSRLARARALMIERLGRTP